MNAQLRHTPSHFIWLGRSLLPTWPDQAWVGELWSEVYLSPRASGLWGSILFKFGQQLGCHVLHFVLIAKGHIHPPVCQSAHQCGPSSSVAPGRVLLTNIDSQEPASVRETPHKCPSLKEGSIATAWNGGCCFYFRLSLTALLKVLMSRCSQQDFGAWGSIKRYSDLGWCCPMSGKPPPPAKSKILKRGESTSARVCAFRCSLKPWTKSTAHWKSSCPQKLS